MLHCCMCLSVNDDDDDDEIKIWVIRSLYLPGSVTFLEALVVLSFMIKS